MNNDSFTLLIVEDDRAQLDRLERSLTRTSLACRITRASTPTAACNQFRKLKPEVVILDLGLSGHGPNTGLDVITKMTSIDPTSRIIVLTGHTGDDMAVQAIRNGAASFVTKPANMVALESLIKDYAQTSKYRRNALSEVEAPPIAGLVGNSAPMKLVYRLIRQCAATDSNVLLVGETGCGKEVIAKAIHQQSSRSTQPLSVYFGAAPASMAESELFGYERGAYTGANPRGHIGCIERGHGGTLFIDELCSLDLDIQRKLLRAVEEKTYRPLGAERDRSSDFRLICAAQPRIYDLVRTAQFREDLLSRVEVITIKIPPLRERRDDIITLAEYFQKLTKDELSQTDVTCQVWGFTDAVQKAFLEYHWPRNVRQLRHVVHNGMIQAQLRGSEQVDLRDVASRLEVESNPTADVVNTGYSPGKTLRESVEHLEREIISESLRRNNNVFSVVCRELGLGRTTLWRKLKQYNLHDIKRAA